MNEKDKVLDVLSTLATHRQRPVLCLYHDQVADEGLDEDCLIRVLELVPALAGCKQLSIMIDSPGGDIECAYRIVRAIRQHADDVEVLVPNWAKSAATFVCLSANRILIGPDGELGPLDPQTKDPSGRSRPVSALETFKGMEHLRNYSLETLDAIVLMLMRRGEMDIPYALEHAKSLFSGVVTPLYQQIDPHELGEFGRYLAVSEEYAVRVMKRWSYRQQDPDNLRRLVSRLVWDYPTHGFVIDLQEAQELGLNAVELDSESDVLCKQILNMVGGYIGIGLPDSKTAEVTACSETAKEEAKIYDGG